MNAASMLYMLSWGGSGIMTSCWGSCTHCMDITWIYKQELGDSIPSLQLNTPICASHGVAKITRAGNWCCQHDIYAELRRWRGIMTSCCGSYTPQMDPTGIYKQELGDAIPSLRLNTLIYVLHRSAKITRAGNWCQSMLSACYICRVEVEVQSWQVVEARVHIAWTQHRYTRKRSVIQFHPSYGTTHPYVPPTVLPKSHVLVMDAASMTYMLSWGGSGIMKSCCGSFTHCMDPA